MKLNDLYKKIDEISDEELFVRLHKLRNLRIKKQSSSSVKTNKEKRLSDLLDKLTPEQLQILSEKLKEMK